MDLNLNLTQQQKLVMSQSMQLSVKLLQLSNIELLEYINKEIQENPVIDVEYKESIPDNMDYKDFSDYFKQSTTNYEAVVRNEDEVSPFNFISEKKSLKDFLKTQIGESNESSEVKALCEYLIESIDSRGYFDENIEEVAKELKIDSEKAIDALYKVQNLEPPGIGARNLCECLKIQAMKKGILDEAMEKIIDEYLDDLANNKYSKMAAELNITIEMAQAYGDVLKSFEPKPSRGFYTGDETKFIAPDAYIERIGNELFIIMNDDAVPRLSVNNMYRSILDETADIDAQKYVKEKINSALFLMKSIEMRRSTIYKVLEQIVEIQRKYFLMEENYLKPMLLKDIAEKLQMHESTISRAIKEKYVYTDRGILKIKDLFNNSISNDSNEDISTKVIKDEIKRIVDNEDKKKPVSDQVICQILIEAGHNISRRTVAKYREEIGIKASSKRKRF